VKVYCKRTLFKKNNNFYPVNGKEYGDDYVEWERGKFYNFRISEDYERGGHTEMFPGIYYYIETEIEGVSSPIKEKEFRKHFMDVDELRNEKIENILK
jgi:hypothetical protein